MEYRPYTLDVRIITLSDRAFNGEYKDLSGPQIKADLETFLADHPWKLSCSITLIPDEAEQLKSTIEQAIKENADVIFTTGGTGLGPRDITPDVITPMLEREIPGIMEFIRIKHGERIPSALLSRSVAGTIRQTQIYTLPGSVRAVKEYTSEIFRSLEHAIFMIQGINSH